jgi:outer membrane protein assembly factor BamB
MGRWVWGGILAAGCQDYNLEPIVDPVTVGPDESTTPETSTEPAVCAVDLADPRSELDPTCQPDLPVGGVPPADPWSWQVKWSNPLGPVFVTPTVGDLDADGIPEVVVPANGKVYALDGRDGSVIWSAGTSIDNASGTALADLDGDGLGEVVATIGLCNGNHTVVAYDHAGAQRWTTPIGEACETYPFVTDLEGDGAAEVIVNEYVLDGATGSVRAVLDFTVYGTIVVGGTVLGNWGAPVAADLDLDGVMEILLEGKVFDIDGEFLWHCAEGGVATFPQPVNADGDPLGEVLVSAPSVVTLCDDDGTVLWEYDHPLGLGTPISVADFDGDGRQEFAFASRNSLALIEGDGTERWSTLVQDGSGLAGPTSWDIDLDGVPEVVFADEQDLLVLNGATGEVVFQVADHGSITLAPTPAAADVDGDGHGELLFGSDKAPDVGVTVIEGAGGDWPFSPPVYNQYGYYGANVADGLSVPPSTAPPWMTPGNLFRGQPSAAVLGGGPNLRAAIHDLCATSCAPDDEAAVSIQVWNDGGLRPPVGVTARLYTAEGALLDEREVPIDLPPGTSYEYVVTTTAGALGSGLTIGVDEDGAVVECNENDNVAPWTGAMPCG